MAAVRDELQRDSADPAHYDGEAVSSAEALWSAAGREAHRVYFWGCAFKYLWRAGKKEGASYEDDIRKAIACLERSLVGAR